MIFNRITGESYDNFIDNRNDFCSAARTTRLTVSLGVQVSRVAKP